MASKANLDTYYQYLIRCNQSFACAYCQNTLLPRDYERHCTRNHNVNASLCCVWCRGEVSWESRKKNKHVDHLIQCFKKSLVVRPQAILSIPPSSFTKCNLKPKCEAWHLFGHSKLPQLDPLAYDLFNITPEHPIRLTFQDENLNSAVSYLRLYLKSLEMHHIMIRASAMNSFLAVSKEFSNVVTFLPFSCWCNGGRSQEDFHRQHRHMIAVAPKGIFETDFWNRFTVRAYKNYKCKKRKRVQSPMHFVNVLGYVSQSESQCRFMFQKGWPDILDHHNHYLITRSLAVDHQLILSVQWKEGISSLFDQKYKYTDPAKFIRAPIRFTDRKWRIKFKDVPGAPLDVVLPVSKQFTPCRHPTEFYVYRANGEKFYFERDPKLAELEDDDEWHREQAERGNLIYHLLGEEWWTPNLYHQKYINDVKPVWEDNDNLKLEVGTLRRELEERGKIIGSEKIIKEKDEIIKEKDEIIKEKDEIIKEKDEIIAKRDQIIAEKDAILEDMKKKHEEKIKSNKLISASNIQISASNVQYFQDLNLNGNIRII